MIISYQRGLVVVMVMLVGYAQGYPVFEFKQESYMIPHPQKAHRGGQDAYFSSSQIMMVADGVGGWNNYGIDPSKFSRFLCHKGSQLFKQDEQFYRQNLVEIIVQSSKSNENLGSATMVAVTLHGQSLKTCYIGDSGFVIFRQMGNGYQLLFQFKQQQHGFNFPFQLARRDHKGDDPYLSICQDFKVNQNDIVVVGSDGLFDNVYVSQILELINKTHTDQLKLFSLKQKLAKLAIERGSDANFWSPFAQRAKQQNINYRGGKLDDTTVIISKITRITPTPDNDKMKIDSQHL